MDGWADTKLNFIHASCVSPESAKTLAKSSRNTGKPEQSESLR